VPFAHWAEERRLGLLHWVALPYALKFILGFLWLDFAIYWQHRLFHEIPALWRAHRVHHADLDLDASSGIRFHPLELLISMAFKWAAIAVLGVHFLAVAVYEIALNAFSILQHSAIDLGRLDAPLRRALVTPDYHRVHHSPERDETDSNYAFLFSAWDRLFGTYRPQPRADHATMPLGLPAPRDARTCASLPAMLALPLKDPR
jgi:sterol desaturase/sphingolipid hydroxylase (fatty acid hydroxylase superfamily)